MAKELKKEETKGKKNVAGGKRGPKPKTGSHKIDKGAWKKVTVFIPTKSFDELSKDAEKSDSDVASVMRSIIWRTKKWPALEKNG